MIALIWKELRENFKWAFLALLAMGAAQCYALFQTPYPGQLETDFYGGITICKTSFLMLTTFGYAAMGLLLGLVQILPELKRDQWAALLHRPVPRGNIFWGKASAGLLLYAFAALPPFLFSVWLAATPGHFGTPFVIEMVRPGAADLCTGVVYYFGALVLALQHGRILRALPLFAAVHVSYFILDCRLFYVAIEAIALMGAVLAIAGWGAIHNQAVVRARPWLSRVAFLIVVFYGACGFGDLLKSITNVVVPAPRREWSSYEFTHEGVPLRLTYVNGVATSVQDVEGKPVTDPKYRPANVRRHLGYLNEISNYIGDSHGWRPWWGQPNYRESQENIVAFEPYTYPRIEQWFRLIKDNSLVCYLPSQKTAVARFGKAGFTPVSAREDGLPPEVKISSANTGSRCFLEGPDFVRVVHLAKREVVNLDFPTPSKVFGVAEVSAYTEDSNRVQVTGVALEKGIAIYDDKSRRITMLPYSRDVSRWGCISLGLNGAKDRFYLRYRPNEWMAQKIKDAAPSYVDETDLQGNVLKSYTLPPLHSPPNPRRLGTILGQWLLSPAFFFGNMAYQKIGAELGSSRLRGALSWQFGSGLKLTQEISFYVTVISLALAAITLAWAKCAQFSWKQACAWSAVVLALNAAGFITFFLAAGWPRLVPCPGCGHRRRLDEERCASCGAEWLPPDPAGTEIFDGTPAQSMAASA